jgi:FAD/FMN-containing dehydrogenase
MADLGDIPHTDDPAKVRRKSRDFTNSPILRQEAAGKTADILVTPRSKADVLRVASACARHRVPVLARGGGTANFGQGIPLEGGIILDMTKLERILWVRDRKVRAEPGIMLSVLDDHLRKEHQQEIRMHPSTRRTATLGGYIAGGHVGVGSCRHGILHDRGNVVAIEAVSVEVDPRVIEVRGRDVNRLHHAYGTNGIITELEMPLAPAYRWLEAIVEFDDFMKVVRFLADLCEEHGMVIKLASGNGWPLPSFFHPLAGYVNPGHHSAHVMVADEFREIFHSMVQDFGGRLAYEGLEGQGPFGIPLYEFSFGHVRRYIDKVAPELIANFGIFPAHDLVGCVERVHRRFAGAPFHIDFKRKDGRLCAQGSPLFPFVSPENFARKVEEFQALGYESANVHTLFVRENGMKTIDAAEIAFKRAMDPHNLMNRGKFSSDDVEKPGIGASLPTSGWTYRKSGDFAGMKTESPTQDKTTKSEAP